MIRSDARELLGDLVVATVELAEHRGHAERWLRLVSAAARARDHSAELIAAFRDVLDDAVLRELRDTAVELAHSLAWERACVYRSGLEDARELAGDRDALETSRIELAMIRWGASRFAKPTVPDGTPPHHWWWFEPLPPSEYSLVMNDRMRELLTIPTDVVPAPFVRLVAGGFVTGDHVRLRDHVFADSREQNRNAIRVEQYLERDESRRPVDLAGQTLACVRYLASELRRKQMPRCRIVVEQRRLLATIRIARLLRESPVDNIEGTETAILVLDSP